MFAKMHPPYLCVYDLGNHLYLRLKIKQDTWIMWSKIHQHNYRLIVIFKPETTATIWYTFQRHYIAEIPNRMPIYQ